MGTLCGALVQVTAFSLTGPASAEPLEWREHGLSRRGTPGFPGRCLSPNLTGRDIRSCSNATPQLASGTGARHVRGEPVGRVSEIGPGTGNTIEGKRRALQYVGRSNNALHLQARRNHQSGSGVSEDRHPFGSRDVVRDMRDLGDQRVATGDRARPRSSTKVTRYCIDGQCARTARTQREATDRHIGRNDNV